MENKECKCKCAQVQAQAQDQANEDDQVALLLQEAMGTWTPASWGIHDLMLDFTGDYGDRKRGAECAFCGPVVRLPCQTCAIDVACMEWVNEQEVRAAQVWTDRQA